MARIFISHSSLDNEPAARMRAWLGRQGFVSAFLDKDSTTGIPPGADWERTLYREIEESQAVIIIQTPNWLASKWCFAEFTQARALGKAIFPAIEAPTGDTLISPDIQTLNLLKDREGGLDRLKRELVRIALDAQGGFEWDAHRPPFPGMLAFEEEDAAVYFGRDDDIRRLIERLEARRAQGGAKLIVLLGSSGSGKSSLLRAGVIPRLKRAGRNWLAVPPMRPGIHPIDELARSLATALGPSAEWRKQRDDLLGGDPVRALNNLANDLRVKAGAAEAQILIPVDQAEELFGVADPDEARRFLDILSRVLSETLPFMTVMALRSDFLGQLQSVAPLGGKFEEFSLGPMALARVPLIMEGPARRTGLQVENEFVQQAARDAETEDALPLLAFTLRELFDRSTDKSLTLQAYKALGDERAVLTPLENAVRKRADEVLAEARPTEEELTALRDAFVPEMVRVNEKGQYVRRPARLDALPAKAQPLLERLARARLLVVRQEGDDRLVEVAHEALLRKWPWLKQRLDAAQEFLIGKQQLEQDLRDWDKAPEAEKAEALLTGLKLSRANGWLIEHPTQLTAPERAFIQAGIDRAEAEKRSREKRRRNTILAWVSAAIFVAVVLAAWAINAFRLQNEKIAQQEKAISQSLAARSQLLVSQRGTLIDTAALLAVEAMRRAPSLEADQAIRKVLSLLPKTVAEIDCAGEGNVEAGLFNGDGDLLATTSNKKTKIWNTSNGRTVASIPSILTNESAFRPGTDELAILDNRVVSVWNSDTGALVKKLPFEGINAIGYSNDGSILVVVGSDKVTRVIDATDYNEFADMQNGEVMTKVAVAPAASEIVVSNDNKAEVFRSAGTPSQTMPVDPSENFFYSPDGKYLAQQSRMNFLVSVLDTGSKQSLLFRNRHWTSSFSGNSEEFAIGSPEWDATVYNLPSCNIAGERLVPTVRATVVRTNVSGRGSCEALAHVSHDDSVTGVELSFDGRLLATTSRDRTVRVWEASRGREVLRIVENIAGDTGGVRFTKNGKLLSAWGRHGCHTWEATGEREVAALSQNDLVSGVAFSGDGARVATVDTSPPVGGFEGSPTARVWTAPGGEEIWRLEVGRGSLHSVALSADGSKLLLDNDSVWQVTPSQPPKELYRLAPPPNGGSPSLKAASGSDDWKIGVVAVAPSTAVIYRTQDGKEIARKSLDAPIETLALAPDGCCVAIATREGGLVLWKYTTREETAFPKVAANLKKLVFDRAADMIGVIGGEQGNDVRVFRLRQRGPPMSFPHETKVYDLAFDPSGQYLATAGNDSAARIWNLDTGELVAQFQHDSEVRSIAFSPNAKYVLSGGGRSDRTGRLWLWRPSDLIDAVCSRLERKTLSQDEWNSYVGAGSSKVDACLKK